MRKGSSVHFREGLKEVAGFTEGAALNDLRLKRRVKTFIHCTSEHQARPMASSGSYCRQPPSDCRMSPFTPFLTSLDLLAPEEEAQYRLDHLAIDGTILVYGAVLFGAAYALLIAADQALLGSTGAFYALLTVRLVFIGFCVAMVVAVPRVRSPRSQEAWALALGVGIFLSNLAVLTSRPRTYSQNVTLEVIGVLTLYAIMPDRRWIKASVPLLFSTAGIFFALFVKVHVGFVALLSILMAYLVAHLIGLTATSWVSRGRRQGWKRERELLELVRERTELAALREAFITTVSHEFRTPLHAIGTSTDILERHRERLEPERHLEMTTRIRSAVLHLTSMIDDVLFMHRLDAGGSGGEAREFPLNPWIQELAASHGATGDTPGVELDLASDLVVVKVNEELLRQVLSNLLNNAQKYTPAEGRVLLRARKSGSDLILELEDTGIGIPLAEQASVFTRFQRGSNSGAVRGTGLGLSIVRDALALLGGDLELDSQEGRGTRIRIRLKALLRGNHAA